MRARSEAEAALASSAAALTADAVKRLAGIEIAPGDAQAALAESVKHG